MTDAFHVCFYFVTFVGVTTKQELKNRLLTL